jgi:hypothetical protein
VITAVLVFTAGMDVKSAGTQELEIFYTLTNKKSSLKELFLEGK